MFNLSVSILKRIISTSVNSFDFILSNVFLILKTGCFILLISVVFTSCKKDTDIGLSTQPAGDKINTSFFDTLAIEAYTVKNDSVKSKNEAYGLLGNYIDPVFGKVSASFLAHVVPVSDNINFGDSAELVSIKLYLDYKGNYGDSSKSQNIQIYKLSQTIYKDTSYYSFRKASEFYNSATFLTSKLINPSSLYSDSLEIDLPSSLGDSILKNKKIIDKNDLLKYIPGLCITTDTNTIGGCIMYFNLTSAKSKIVLSYKQNNSDTVVKTCNFVINQNSARVNLFTHDYSNTNFYSQINSTSPVQDSVFYIQPMAGVRGFIKLPTADKLALKQNVAIVKATLIIPVEQNDLSISTYDVPSKLMLFEKQPNNSDKLPPDFFLGEDTFDGNYYPSEGVYKFNITIEMQKLIDGIIPNYGYYLVSNDLSKSNRVVLTSGINSNKIRLQISYVKF